MRGDRSGDEFLAARGVVHAGDLPSSSTTRYVSSNDMIGRRCV
jgi:hypothetical protein